MAPPELSEVRLPIDLKNLAKYLATVNKSTPGTSFGVEVPRFPDASTNYDIQQFKFGQSNPTYLLRHGSSSFVLRRKPSPNNKLVSRSAHAIEREFFLLRAIGVLNQDNDRKVPVPNVFLLCEDESVIGYCFYLMEFIQGEQLKNPSMPEISDEDRPYYWKSVMDTITAIHLLDGERLIAELPKSHFPQFHDLAKLKSSSYFARQIKTLSAVSRMQLAVVPEIPDFEAICKWTMENAPKDPDHLTLIHGDFKIDNVLFDPKTKSVRAVLDWELCTFGHPLFDLANFLQPFQLPNQVNLMLFRPYKTTMGKENPDSINTIYEKLRMYHQSYGKESWENNNPTNNAPDLWLVGTVFGFLRLAVISQGIAMRVKKGSASSGEASGYAEMYPFLAALAMECMLEFDEKRREKLKL